MMNTGLSFSPTDAANDPNKPKGTGNPVQDAIQLLSFRLPSFLGATAPPLQGGAPSALGSQLGGGIAQEWLKRFFQGSPQGQTPAVPGSAPGGGSATPGPPPNVAYPYPPGGDRIPSPPRPTPDPNAPPARTATVTPTPAYTPPTAPQQRSGGSWQDWPDPFRGMAGRNQ